MARTKRGANPDGMVHVRIQVSQFGGDDGDYKPVNPILVGANMWIELEVPQELIVLHEADPKGNTTRIVWSPEGFGYATALIRRAIRNSLRQLDQA